MRKIVVNAMMMFLCANVYCQNQESKHNIKFGFNLGLNYSNIQVRNADPAVQYFNSEGFRLGILLDWKLTKHLSFSPKAETSINNPKVLVTSSSNERKFYQVFPTLFEFALHLTYKFSNNNTTPYLLFGPTYKLQNSFGRKKSDYAAWGSDIAIDLGFGLDKKLTFFNIAPEFRYSFGLINLSNIKEVGQLYFHNITLVLNFKG